MSTILSADSLNDFISPGVACIKPIETIPAQSEYINPYEVTTEDKLAAQNPQPTSISLTDCLACSGCVTSAEAVLVALQSHEEVLKALDEAPMLDFPWEARRQSNGVNAHVQNNGRMYVATVSPQARASLAATYQISSKAAGELISQVLCGPNGLASGGKFASRFTWVLDTNVFRSIALVAAADEVDELLRDLARTPQGDGNLTHEKPKKPILASACPGWICYAEKQHPHILPHLSRLKSPQALAGTMLKSVLYKKYGIRPEQVWHLAIMPCFDKKLEASRSELMANVWAPDSSSEGVRDVDCVITPRELINLATARGINLQRLIHKSPVPASPFPDEDLNNFLFPKTSKSLGNLTPDAGSSGGYLYHILRRAQAANPGSSITVSRGRNADVIEFALIDPSSNTPILKCARSYGFRNIQNLVRKLKPAQTSRLLAAAGRQMNGGPVKPLRTRVDDVDYAYVEVMACPGGCTNGGGQIRAGEVESLRTNGELGDAPKLGLNETKAWLAQVDEAYFSADEDEVQPKCVDESDMVDGISRNYISSVVTHWERLTGVDGADLLRTSYRKVESDVGKKKTNNIDRVVGLASSIGGGW